MALGSPDVVQLANRYYAWVHFPAAAAMLLGLWFFAREQYLWVRRVMATMTMVALVLHVVMPLAPPRMLPGFVDTGLAYNESVYSSPTAAALANQYAAMPSLHVGWAIIVAAAVIATFRSRWRYLILAHPTITVIVVVVTANHYWLDALVAGALFAVSLALVGPRGALLAGRTPSPPSAAGPAPTVRRACPQGSLSPMTQSTTARPRPLRPMLAVPATEPTLAVPATAPTLAVPATEPGPLPDTPPEPVPDLPDLPPIDPNEPIPDDRGRSCRTTPPSCRPLRSSPLPDPGRLPPPPPPAPPTAPPA